MTGNQRAQQGIILIGLMIVLVLAAGATFLQQANRSNAMAIEREAKTMAALLAARDALLARAVLDNNRPGSLRCPATDNSGTSPWASTCPSYTGWLPWRTLDLPDPRDGSGTQLWYVLSPAFRDGSSNVLNTTTAASLSLDGQADIVALIIAPGGALGGQNRPSNDPANYLDDLNGNAATSNRDGDDHFFSGPPGPYFNDRVVALTRETLLNAIAMRVLGEIRYAVLAAPAPLPEADVTGDGIPDSGADSGRFPYLAYANIQSTSWPPHPPDNNAIPPVPSIPHKWYESLEGNQWFPLIAYNRTDRSISLYGQTMLLP